jgi:hypothetical protein
VQIIFYHLMSSKTSQRTVTPSQTWTKTLLGMLSCGMRNRIGFGKTHACKRLDTRLDQHEPRAILARQFNNPSQVSMVASLPPPVSQSVASRLT